jgi:lipooligosaccharide transport system permease protein
VHSPWALATLPLAALLGLAVAAPALRWLAYASPLWHGVDLCRAATLGVPAQWSVAGHLGYLALWAVGGWWLAWRAFHRRLVD